MILRQDWMLRTVVPLVAIFCATATEIAMQSTQGERASLLVLLTCIWGISWAFGLRSGLIATGVGAAAALYYVIPPANSFRILNLSDGVQFGLFGVQGVLASVFCEMRRQAVAATAEAQTRERAARSEADSAVQQVARCRQELKRARSDWNTVSGAVSRELQSRMGAVSESLQLLDGGNLAAANQELVASMRRQAQAAWPVTEAMLTYARACDVEQGRLLLNIGDLWDEALAKCQTRFGRTFVVRRGEMPDVRADEAALLQAFEYIAQAAIPFAAADKPIEISVTVGKMPGDWTFSVSDTGEQGVGAEGRPEAASTETVLHLAICRRLMESQGGRMWTAGRLAGGAVCVFSMPRLRS
jgi:K+-sensing histidine kinase KdpD